jgi:PKD repeat protein
MTKKLLRTILFTAISLINAVSFSQVSFNSSTTSGCAPLSVTFFNSTTAAGAYQYRWNFGDGTPQFIDTMPTTVTHIFNNPGNYNVFLDVYTSAGAYVGSAGNSSGSIFVNGVYLSSVDSACIGDMVNFCASGPSINSTSWNFGDPASGANNTSSQNCPTHAFASNGTYTVTLTVNSGACGTSVVTKNIIVGANVYPHPSAWAYPSPSCPGQLVGLNTEGYAAYSWNFSDPASGAGNTSSLQNPQHSYSSLGVFTASLTVTNGCGHTGTATTTVNIVSSPPFPNYPGFSLQANSPVCPNSSVGFNAPGGSSYTYEWNFGDGSPLQTTTNQYTNHTYGATLGSFPASVRIISACGNDTTLYSTVVVSSTAPFPTGPGFTLNTSSPSCPNSNVNFEAPGGYTSYQWNYGDGSPVVTSTSSYTNHYYGSTLTTYTVSVTITNGCGNTTTLTKPVVISSSVGFPNYSGFSVNVGPNPICMGDAANFNAPYGYSNYAWVFGDGNTASSSSYHISHAYAANGTYAYSVTITNACGNDTTLNGSIVVNSSGSFPSWLQIDADPASACPGDLIEFRLNQSGFQSYTWNYGDGSPVVTTTGDRIQHAFASTGTYTVTCLVTNGCGNSTTVTTTISITNTSPVDPELSVEGVQNPSCPNDEVFFVFHAGQSNYTYTWNFGDGSPVETTIGVGASHAYAASGTYTVSVTATNACGATLTITTTQVVSASAMPVLVNATGERLWGFPGGDGDGGSAVGIPTAGCPGDAIVFYFEGAAAGNVYNFGDGTIATAVDQLVVYGGDGAFPVTIIRHAFPSAGNYLVSLTLTNGCGNSVTDTMSVHIGGGLPVDGDMTTSPPPFTTCAAIDFLAFGGSDYSWNFGDGATLTTSSSSVSHTFASAGVYVVTVDVTNGCGNTATFSRSLNVDGTGGPAVSLTSSASPTCIGGSNGSASISVTSGQAPYMYAWNDPAAQSSATATGLAAGIYYATVTDANGCASTLAINVNDPAPIITSVSTTTTACGAATGTATAAISSGGTGPYTYLWSTGITTATATGLASGAYTVTITDANGCTTTANASVSENGGASLAVNTVTNATCNGAANGAIDLNVSGGAAPYTYLWSNSATVQDPSGMAAGNYSVTVTDASGCHATLNATISQPSAIVVATSVVTAPTCGNFDGKATASASGGSGPYTYLWDANAGSQTTQTAVGLPAGTYTVTVTDASGCSMDASIDLSNSNAPNITGSVTNVSCYGLSNGAVDITVTGGTSPYLYTWNVPPPQTNHQDLNTLLPGNYIVLVQDAHGCLSFRSYTVTQSAVLTATVTNTGATCGNNDATATATPVGGNTSFSYAWTGGQTAQTATGLSIGNYTVTVMDNRGCIATATTSVAATTIPQEICMVTVDAASTHNIIYWEKPSVSNLDSFRIYREDVTNVYTLIGAVHYDSLSEYHDYGADPNVTTKRYKMTAVDNCGGESDMSNYHNTIYIVDNGMGQFTWNPIYTIENGANPVNNYNLMRDDNNTGSWNLVGSTAGTQNTLADPAYMSYPNGQWYVETAWGITCTPTRATVNTSRSNIKHAAFSVGIQTSELSSRVNVYPNPASDYVSVELPAMNETIKLKILNTIGQMVYDQEVSPSANASSVKQINTAGFAKGVYTIVVETGTAKVFKKLVIN